MTVDANPANLCYAQSGGVTAVINVSAAAVIDAARKNPAIGKVYAAKNGILGVLHEELIETWRESEAEAAHLPHTPGGAFGSCRVKLPEPTENLEPFKRIFDVFRTRNIQYLLYNGGNDSADTALKLSEAAAMLDWPLTAVGVPKTIDNDLPFTDSCPGYGSAAKYIAVSAAETMLDVESMSRTSTKVFILEVMGRNAGWLAAAAGLPAKQHGGPIMILPPETPYRPAHFTPALKKRVEQYGFCMVAVAEGLREKSGEFVSASKSSDAFSHKQLGGVAPRLAQVVQKAGFKCHWSVADYLQRSARHIASETDVAHARAVGEAAVQYAAEKKNAVMPIIKRTSDVPYKWEVEPAMLKMIANRERKMPVGFYDKQNYRITPACRRYLTPLVSGEAYPPYDEKTGLPIYARLKNIPAAKKLPPWDGKI